MVTAGCDILTLVEASRIRRTHGRKLSTGDGGDLVGFTSDRITSFNVGEFL
jgi:hypothetical protein